MGVGGEELVGADGAIRLRPRASPTAQEGTASHSEEATSPADKHGLTKLKALQAMGFVDVMNNHFDVPGGYDEGQ